MHDFYDYLDQDIQRYERHYRVEVYDRQERNWRPEGEYYDWDLDHAITRCITKASEEATQGRVQELNEDLTLVYQCECDAAGIILSESGWYIEERFDPVAFGLLFDFEALTKSGSVPWALEGF